MISFFRIWISNIYLCRLVLRFLDFLSGMLTKYLLNARFQNSDFVFRQLKPGIAFVRFAAKKVTKPRKSRRAKIYIGNPNPKIEI